MFDSSVATVFPLPLTAFEKYMLLDDRPDYPMTFPFRLRLSGEISRPIFESSFEEALSHHPLLCALVNRSAWRGPAWVLAEGSRPSVDWGLLGDAIGSPRGEKIDLNTEVGLRVWVRQGDGSAEVTFQFHHSCCDGIGALRFIGHLLAVYAARVPSAGRCPKPWPTDPASLLGRGRFVADVAAGKGKQTRAIWAGLRDAVRWVSRRPAPLCPNAPLKKGATAGLPSSVGRNTRGNTAGQASSGTQTLGNRLFQRAANAPAAGNHAAPLPFLETYRHVFEESETKNLFQAAARQRVTANDLLLRDIFLALRQWNAEQAPKSADRWLRIAVPVKLKTRDDRRMSAANGVSYNFLTRRESQCVDRSAFLQGISRENDPAIRYRRGTSFLRGFRCMEFIPGAIPLLMGANRCFSTAVLSNLGNMRRYFGKQFPCESGKIVAGNLVLEDIFGAPPIRPNTHAAFAIGTYGGRLWVCVRRDPRALTADGIRRLLGIYVNRLGKSTTEFPAVS